MHRRSLIIASLAGMGVWSAAAIARAAALALTPRQAEGPFYPTRFPADVDNDLTVVDGQSGLAHGELTLVSGRVLDADGRPLKGIAIEIWQVNGYGRYHHEGDQQDKPIDPNFQGYGRTVSDQDGGYWFRTVKPVAYPGRAPHIHFMLSSPQGHKLTTQMYLAGAPENERDFLLSRVRDPQQRERLIVPLERSSSNGELAAAFDIVLP